MRAQPDEVYTFIVRWAQGRSLTELFPVGTDLSGATDLPIITGAALLLRVKTAFALADDPRVLQVWYLHPDLASVYVDTIKGIDYLRRTFKEPMVMSISVGPPLRFWSEDTEFDEPMHSATRAAAEAGLIPVMAIGNTGDGPVRRDGLVHPWARPPWVLRVGAFDDAAHRVASFSARGHPERPETWPDVVAKGVDVIGAMRSDEGKSEQRRQRDEASAEFLAMIPPEKRSLYTLESGTSHAVPLVALAVSQVIFFVQNVRSRDRFPGLPVSFELTTPPTYSNPSLEAFPRLVGSVGKRGDGCTVFTYGKEPLWKLVIQLMRDTALHLPGVPPTEGGAGRVTLEYIREQFGRFGLVDPKKCAIKVIG